MLCEDTLQSGLAADLDGNFERLVLAFQDRLYSFGLRLSGNPQDAEEIAQDAFVRAYRALQSYPAERVRLLTLKAWLYQIALNVARNRVRGKRLQLVQLDKPVDGDGDGLSFEPQDDETERPESLFERAERKGELGALVGGLPERYRAAVVLRHIEDLSYAEVATVLDQPVGTAKANVHRGIQLLRDAMSKHLSEVN